MDKKTKIIYLGIIVLVVIVAGLGILKFSAEKNDLADQKKALESEVKRLTTENDTVKAKQKDTEAKAKDLLDRFSRIKNELVRLEKAEKDRDEYKKKYEDVSKEKDLLTEELKKRPMKVEAQEKAKEDLTVSSSTGQDNDAYWADVVQAKASLEVKLDNLTKELADTKGKISELDRANQALNLKIDDLTKEKTRLERDLDYKEKTLNLVSRDLVNEREAKRIASDELARMRTDNMGLKRELVLTNKEKTQLQNDIKNLQEKKDALEGKIVEIESIFKEKSLALGELQSELNTAITDGKITSMKQAGSVQLPPIVVKPEASAIKGLKGSVIAVNQEEKFVVIDLGEASGLRPGAKLKVLRGDKEIASVEIIETRKEISAAEIKENVSGFSIQEGDTIASR